MPARASMIKLLHQTQKSRESFIYFPLFFHATFQQQVACQHVKCHPPKQFAVSDVHKVPIRLGHDHFWHGHIGDNLRLIGDFGWLVAMMTIKVASSRGKMAGSETWHEVCMHTGSGSQCDEPEKNMEQA